MIIEILLPFILIAVFTGFILIEIYFIDPKYWINDKRDKPGSTLIYISVVFIVSLGLFLIDLSFYQALIFGVCCRLSFFDPILNRSGKLPSGKRSICYHSERLKPEWNKKKWKIRAEHKFKDWVKYYSDLINYHYEKFWRKIGCGFELGLRTLILIVPILIYY